MKESFFSKVSELLSDYAQHTVTSINDFPSILDSLRENLNSLIAKASDAKDKLKLEEQSGKKKRKREVENWLTEVQNIENKFLSLENEVQSQGFISRFLVGGEAGELNERVDELVEQSRHFSELALDVYEVRGGAFSITEMVGKAFKENVERVWRLLVIDKVSSIGICGISGVGKTTLTKHIHRRLIEETQECVFWVTMSQEFSIMMLQDKISRTIKLDLSDELDEDKRAATLHRALQSLRTNFILVLDDVCEDISWEKMGDPLRVVGCQLIITTRSSKVCHQMDCQEVIEVEALHMDEAWDLFGEILGRQTALNPQVQEIAKSMVEMCDGLPLSIITLAGSMRGETVTHAWRGAMDELKKSVMGDNAVDDKVSKILKYSIDLLDQVSRLCFLWCSLYPQDHKIPRSELIKNFSLEELVGERKSMKAQFDDGNSILDKLVSLCLLESTKIVVDRDSVKMHNLVRTVALKITEGKTKVIGGHSVLKEIPNEEVWSKDLVKMSLMHNNIKEISSGISPPNCPNLSTLLLQKNLHLRFIADSFFSQMHSLHTLNLSETDIEVLPDSLSDLERLKALILGNCTSLVYVPYLGKMKELTQLDLSHTSIKEVPPGMEKLVNLKFLSMKNVYNKLEIFPTGLLPNLEKIQCLHIPYEVETPVEDVECLKHLEEFEGRVKNVCDFNRFVKPQESKEYSTSYCIEVGREHLDEEEEDYENSVEGTGYTSVVFFKTDLLDEEVIILPDEIGLVKFFKCEGLSNCFLDSFDIPNSLHTLEIKKCEKIECILKNDRHAVALEHVTLVDLPDFMAVIHKQNIEAALVGSSLFSSLTSLWISDCNKMKKLGLPASELTNLETLSIKKCSDIEEIIEEGGGDILTISLPKLKWLELYKLPRLRSICKATMICDSIHMINLAGCPLLKKVPLYFPRDVDDDELFSPPTTLRGIEVGEDEEEWWESLEWEHPSHRNLLQPFVTFDGSSEVFY